MTTFDANWHKWSAWQGHEIVYFWVRRSKSHKADGRFGGLAEASAHRSSSFLGIKTF